MVEKIKIEILGQDHSVGRGVGFYVENLTKTLVRQQDIILTDSEPDLVHYPFFDLFYHTLPFIKKKPTIVTIHDVTPLILKDRYPKGLRGSLNFWLQRLSLLTVNAILTDSQYSKIDIVKYLSVPPEKVFVVPLAIDSIYQKDITKNNLKTVREKYHLPDKFILTVAGGPNPNKNLPALAKVAAEIDIPLMIVGKGLLQEVKEPIHPELIDLVELKKYPGLLLPGYVSTEDLNALYRLASLYVQPSLYEGFGLPLLEAMTAGCLVASSNSSSLSEIYHHEAINFDPKNISDMKAKILEALNLSKTERQKQIIQAKKRSTDFSWEKTALETVKVYNIVFDNYATKRNH